MASEVGTRSRVLLSLPSLIHPLLLRSGVSPAPPSPRTARVLSGRRLLPGAAVQHRPQDTREFTGYGHVRHDRREEDITVKRRRHTPEQIVRKLREVERLLGEGQTIAEAAKQVEISEQTYHRWRNQYGGMKADDAKWLRELERENARLKRIVADKELEIDALKEIAKGNW